MDRHHNDHIVDEKDLVRRAASGDTQAFERLVIIHQRYAYNLALRGLGDPQEAEDVTQEAFLRAWKGLPRFNAKSRFSTWLYRIVMNLCYDRLPDLRRNMQAADPEDYAEIIPDAADDTLFGYSDTGADPERAALLRERVRYLQSEIDRLPNSYAVMVLLRYVLDYRYEEIAGVLDIPLGTVKTGLHRARNILRASLAHLEEVTTQ